MTARGFFALLAVLCASLRIASTPLSAQTAMRLIPGQRFGWEDPAGPAGTTPAQRRLDGGMLSQVNDLAEARNGDLYVLDRDAFKVVVFDKNGVVRRIAGGKGAGPGEFTHPNSIALSEAGELFVLDGGQSRVSVFDPAGKLARTFSLTAPLVYQIRASRDRLYISHFFFKGGSPVVFVYDFQGKLLDKTFTPSNEDASFGPTGNTYRMAAMRDGQIAVAHLNPGSWSLVSAPTTILGHPVVPDNVPRLGDGVWSAPASLRGFGELSGNRALVLFDRSKPNATPEHPAVSIFLALVNRVGAAHTTIDVGEAGRNLLVSHDGSSFYMTVAEPPYQVVRYHLAPK